MLYLHTSNQLEGLKNKFVSTIKTPLSSVFNTELVVVQNAGMARWLSMQVADANGISANTEYLFPAEFMWRILRLVSADIPEQSECSPETLRFHIMEELLSNVNDYPELHHYILDNDISDESINEPACWKLSCEISQLLDQYLFYRANWIQDWESDHWDSKNHWQSRLWQRCVRDKNLVHWLALQNQFKQAFQTIDSRTLPERITFFSMSALSPGYIDLIGDLGKKTDVHLFILNPCEDVYWGDLLSEKSRAKQNIEEQGYIEVGNPLLASMGKQGRDFIDKLHSLHNLETPSVNAYTNETQSLLHKVQQDVYDLEEPQEDTIEPDTSITINACHTPMREVEVLHDQILHELDTDPELTPSDIVVMMPDVESYAPYIEAVFATSQQKLPFSIADRNPLDVFQIIEALDKIMLLADTRYDVESVFELLNYNELRNKFNLDESQVNKCRELARASNIRWGISAKTRHGDDLPNSEEHTWKYALDRVLLGYSLTDTNDTDQQFESDRVLSLLAYSGIEGSDAVMLANFKQFTDCIFSISDWSNQRNTLAKWIKQSKRFIQEITTESSDQQMILSAISEVEIKANLAEFTEKLSFTVYQDILKQCLQNINAGEKYLGYGITFCALVPMRSVPFKIIALMGMNDGEFPRQDKHHSFDLMASKPQRGDRSRRDEDRYLFLESILAVREKLIISYIGQSVKDNKEMPPSVLVSELMDVILVYTGNQPEDLVVKHPLQAFNPRYFDGNQQQLFSYAQEYSTLVQYSETPSEIFITEILEPLDDSFKTINLDDFINFYKNPARAFLKHRFSIQTFDQDLTLLTREPFELESFKDQDLRKLVLERDEESIDKQLLARANGLLPYGQIGEEIFQKQKQITETFVAELAELESNEESKFSKYFSYKIDDFVLEGQLDSLTDNGRFVQQVTRPYAAEYISLWINHLVLNFEATEENTKNNSHFYSPETKFFLKPVINAHQILSKLLNYYWEGLHFPLQFFPKTSLSLYEQNKTFNTAKISSKWNGNDRYAGEKDKFENWLLHRNLEINKENKPEAYLQVSHDVFGILFEYLEEIE